LTLQSKKLTLGRLAAQNVRNLEPIDIELGSDLNLVFGDNGHGKTSLLEAAYLVATTKSFRAQRARDATRYGAPEFHVRAVFTEQYDSAPALDRAQAIAVGATTHATIEGNRPPTLAAYAAKSPVVVFHPGDLTLSSGPAAGRRRLLDRIALYARPADAQLVNEYARAARARQDLLRRGASASPELDAYEHICADAGARLTRSRQEAADRVIEHARAAFREIGDPELDLRISFEEGGSPDPETARKQLFSRRGRDERLQSASWGPHKDDLALVLDGHSARKSASQGQHRTLTLSLKAAEASAVRAVTGVEPIQLLDDVSSELDPERTRALLQSLAKSRAQILISTTRPELIREHFPEASETRAFHVIRGRVERTS